MPTIIKVLEDIFGETASKKTGENYGRLLLERRKSGKLKMASSTGMLGVSGITKVAAHNFYGTKEETT